MSLRTMILFRQVENIPDGLDDLRGGELTGLDFVEVRIVEIQPSPLSDPVNQPHLGMLQVDKPLSDVLTKRSKLCHEWCHLPYRVVDFYRYM